MAIAGYRRVTIGERRLDGDGKGGSGLVELYLSYGVNEIPLEEAHLDDDWRGRNELTRQLRDKRRPMG